jgi:excinuclease ABC subunit B
MYADEVTESMRRAIKETNRRRNLQISYNKRHGIKPETIRKAVTDIIQEAVAETPRKYQAGTRYRSVINNIPKEELEKLIQALEEEMRAAAEELNFEQAAVLRDEIAEMKKEFEGISKRKSNI